MEKRRNGVAVPTERQKRNLKRGGIKGTPETARRARSAKAANQQEVDRVGEKARNDIWSTYDELHSAMAKQVTRLLQQELRENAKPDRSVTDRLREFRQMTVALTEYRGTHRTMLDEAREFFAELDSRLENILGPDYPSQVAVFPIDEDFVEQERQQGGDFSEGPPADPMLPDAQ